MTDTAFRAAERLSTIRVSEILSRSAHAIALRRQGKDMIIFGAGEPDFDTPNHIKDAANVAIAAGDTKYTALGGSPTLKNAVAAKFLRDNGLHFAADELIVATGAKQILYNAMMATLDRGDEVIVPAPYWTSYIDIVSICGGVPKSVQCQEADGFLLTPEALEQAITPRTRWLMLNSPGNPSGAAYRRQDLAALSSVLERHPHVWVISDDIYEKILFDGIDFQTLASVRPDLAHRILTVNGVSKSHAMTGWRIGYAGGPRSLIAAMMIVQSQTTSCPSSIGQAAAVAALNGPEEPIADMVASFAIRRDRVVAALDGVAGLSCRRPEGAFYAYAGCAALIGARTPADSLIVDDRTLADYLLEFGVAVIPGACFGLSPYFRLSYACSDSDLAEGLSRIVKACATLTTADT